MRYRVVMTMHDREPSPITVKVFEDAGIDWEYVSCRTEEEVVRAAKNADGILISNLPRTSRKVMESLPRLKFVGRNGVGVDSVDLEAATELGVCVGNNPGINTSEVADHAMALLLSITRRIPELNALTRSGAWGDDPKAISKYRTQLRRIAGKVIGIYGFGNIGRGFAQRVRGFGPAEIIAHDPYVPQTAADLYGVRLVDFDALLRDSDVITAHSPSTSENRHVFDSGAFDRMKTSAIFINCARGPLVDETALQIALETGKLAAAGIDVTEIEPLDAESPLLKLPNLTITPHIAGGSDVTTQEGARRWADNAVRLFTQKPMYGFANPDVIKVIALLRAKGDKRWEGTPDPVTGRGF